MINIEIIKAIEFGTEPITGLFYPYNWYLAKFDQHILPIVYRRGPKNISWYIAVLITLFPGIGLLHIL